MRKLASIRVIDAIDPIPEADAIEVATVGGWKVVVKRGEFQAGTLAVYFEIDSWIPHEMAPFLSKGKEPRVYNGVKGERLKTIKLRGQVSQGLLVKPADVMNAKQFTLLEDGEDVTELLGVQKWEAPIPAQLAGKMRGYFPGFIPKTDQERIQNLKRELEQYIEEGDLWEVTEKLDGSSMTVYVRGEDSGVCSRNIDLLETEGNTFWQVTRQFQLLDKIKSTGRNLALQGEVVGEGIQGNPYKLKGYGFYLFDVYDIDRGHYLPPGERQELARALQIQHVPVYPYVALNSSERDTVEFLLKAAYGISKVGVCLREGLVFKRSDGTASFKVISNEWLLKGGN